MDDVCKNKEQNDVSCSKRIHEQRKPPVPRPSSNSDNLIVKRPKRDFLKENKQKVEGMKGKHGKLEHCPRCFGENSYIHKEV